MDLAEALEDECARALMASSARMPGTLWRDLVPYLALFRPRTQALRWSRALALAEEVCALLAEHEPEALCAALRETVASLAERRASPEWRPLGNHRYLRRVLASVSATARSAPAPGGVERQRPSSWTGKALSELEEFKRG